MNKTSIEWTDYTVNPVRWGFFEENLADDEGHVDDEPDLYRIGKHKAGATLDGREWKQFPLR